MEMEKNSTLKYGIWLTGASMMFVSAWFCVRLTGTVGEMGRYLDSMDSVVCMEECSELIKAISKRLRGELDIENNLAEEMADVTICLYQLARMYDVDDTDVHAWIDRKTERQRKRNALQDHQSGETTR